MLIIGKFFIFLFCAFFQLYTGTVSISTVAILLTAVILTCLPSLFPADAFSQKWLSRIILGCWSFYLFAAIPFQALRCYIPLAFWDICALRLIAPAFFSCALLAAECIRGQYSMVHSPAAGIFLLLLSAVSILLQQTVHSNIELSARLKLLRDSSKERELLIEEKNLRMRAQQDAELYAATLKERNRIAREIHDNVGHMLTRSILQVGAIKIINSNEALNEPLDGLHKTLNTAMTNIRASVHDLHDESIDLLTAIHDIIDSVTAFSIHLDYAMESRLPQKLKYCFISIIREAVNNALKHSNATQMEISLLEHPAFYQLLIQDNGTSSDPAACDGIGLTNMKDRVRLFNGNIQISNRQGFKILISILKSNITDDN